jgi:hypothetical protein
MAFLIREDVPAAVAIESKHGIAYFRDPAGQIWYQPRGHQRWCCRGESAREFLKRIDHAAELRSFTASHPGAIPFGPIDECLRSPLTEYEKQRGFGVAHSSVWGNYLIVPKGCVDEFRGVTYFTRFASPSEHSVCAFNIHKNSWMSLPLSEWEFEARCQWRSSRRCQTLDPTAAYKTSSFFGKLYRARTRLGKAYGPVYPLKKFRTGRKDSLSIQEDILKPQFAKHFPEQLALTRDLMLLDNDLGLDFWVLPSETNQLSRATKHRLFYVDHYKCYYDLAGVWHFTMDVPVPDYVAAKYERWTAASCDAKELNVHLIGLAQQRKHQARPLLELSTSDCPPYQVCKTSEGLEFYCDERNKMWTWTIVTDAYRHVSHYTYGGAPYREWVCLEETATLGDHQEKKALADNLKPRVSNAVKASPNPAHLAVGANDRNPNDDTSTPPQSLPKPSAPPSDTGPSTRKKPPLDLSRFRRLTLPDDADTGIK